MFLVYLPCFKCYIRNWIIEKKKCFYLRNSQFNKIHLVLLKYLLHLYSTGTTVEHILIIFHLWPSLQGILWEGWISFLKCGYYYSVLLRRVLDFLIGQYILKGPSQYQITISWIKFFVFICLNKLLYFTFGVSTTYSILLASTKPAETREQVSNIQAQKARLSWGKC